MDRERLFEKLDIESPEEFKFYENFDALMEEDEHIEEELISELVSASDASELADHIDSFFASFANNIPDEETELYIAADAFKSNLLRYAREGATEEDLLELASEIYKFRRWYVIDLNAFDEDSGEDISIRDARYEIAAGKFLDETRNFDFGKAFLNGPDSYKVMIKDILDT